MCQTAICPLCNRKSWTGCGQHIPSAMSNTRQELWCTCTHILDTNYPQYPPRAGTGSARRSISE
ncbi:Hypothetical protein PP7435_CHR1-2225 [Komagataella phaffii CBS 7435]|uniref:Uncharacterized protein n=2 Tax=Komagataella phaffii TaxID=460519 RepID=C4QWT7_KOMPG|nr:Hypothetical protein PAS_chr1-1_0333 [Komagataella phaffii GS115]CAH2446502.1 Hypothetical protein BQ9382_C1-3358 [Komagataella phaffii CBS 7435]CAY67710.1 Hypothetical protein PAS_chr1-1_0333 [Komagataella phaffii GS115]SCV11827.1 Hypothetical protein PP7435_CHR1-2225 [Komagataella phaffii CBS 7435]